MGIEQGKNDEVKTIGAVLHVAPGVVKNLAITFAVAQLVLEFPLPDDVDAAPVFEA